MIDVNKDAEEVTEQEDAESQGDATLESEPADEMEKTPEEALADLEAAGGGADVAAESELQSRGRVETGLELKAEVEAIIFASQKPMRSVDILDLLADPDGAVEAIDSILETLAAEYEERGGGFRLVWLKGMGYQFQSVAEAGPLMERLFASRPRPISRAALETLSVIAYRQPATRATIEFIRGVDSGSIVKNLLERGLIKCTGRKEDAPGRPMVFGTTDEFLRIFGITSVKDLPPLQSFQPDSEAMKEALEELEKVENGEAEGVDVENFVGDEEREVEVGAGVLLNDSEAADSVQAAAEEALDGEASVEEISSP